MNIFPFIAKSRPGRGNTAARWMVCVAAGVALAAAAGPALDGEAPVAPASADLPSVVRFAFSRAMFKELNEDDARAAMKAYSQAIANDNGFMVERDPKIYDSTNAIVDALHRGAFDMLSLTAEEFVALESEGLDGPLMVSQVNQEFTEQYVLLARIGAPIKQVQDLPGSRLIMADGVRASLAPLWLESLCRENGVGSSGEIFSSRTSASKPALIILPVFFGKADVCLTTRSAWLTMGELNPQVTNQLCAIASSPPLVPALSCFRRGLSESVKSHLMNVAAESADKVSFKQLMALFKTERLRMEPSSALDSTREFVARYHKLCRPEISVGSNAPPVQPSHPNPSGNKAAL